MKAETRLAKIMAMPDGSRKLYKLWEFSAICTIPYSPLWKMADCEMKRLTEKGVKYIDVPEEN